ncbi:MAG: V-type ATPase subunit [Eubacteriales bacterium]|nr:V-type ATPase subunit [Eubacteriales bacterium]
MSNLLSYSGLSTKIRAMQKKLITEDQLREIAGMDHVSQVAAYLKKTPQYRTRWASLDENLLHRGQMEKLLKQSIFEDFSRIYQFSNREQRKFLSLYSKRYEIRVLKEIMTNLFDRRESFQVDFSAYAEFFRKHSKLDLNRLISCTNMDEFIQALAGNEFYEPLSRIQGRENALLFDYGMALDLYYFSYIWNMRKKLFTGKDLEEITKAYGEKFDLLNLQFIQRSRQIYHLSCAEVYTQIIPVSYKLKKEEIKALTEAETNEEFASLLRKTYYGRKNPSHDTPEAQLTPGNLEEFYNYTLRSILENEARRDPYSVAVIYSYLYHKEHEVVRLTIALECVRYNVSISDTMRYIHRN